MALGAVAVAVGLIAARRVATAAVSARWMRAPALFTEHTASRGERHPPLRAVQKLTAELSLKMLDVL
jgi:hypothetical protein